MMDALMMVVILIVCFALIASIGRRQRERGPQGCYLEPLGDHSTNPFTAQDNPLAEKTEEDDG